MNKFPDMDIHIIYIDASLRERKKRAKLKRSDYHTSFASRVLEEEPEFNDFLLDMIEGTPQNVHFQYFHNEDGLQTCICESVLYYIMTTYKNESK